LRKEAFEAGNEAILEKVLFAAEQTRVRRSPVEMLSLQPKRPEEVVPDRLGQVYQMVYSQLGADGGAKGVLTGI
jgi:hypothetical protein